MDPDTLFGHKPNDRGACQHPSQIILKKKLLKYKYKQGNSQEKNMVQGVLVIYLLK